MEVNVLLTFIGILVWPELTFCIILWMLGHPILCIIALLTTLGSTKTIIKEKYIDNKGNIKKINEYEE